MTGEWEWPKRRQLGDWVGVEFKDRVGVTDLVGVAMIGVMGRMMKSFHQFLTNRT